MRIAVACMVALGLVGSSPGSGQPARLLPPPPMPPPAGAPLTDALRALGGEWRLASIDAKPASRPVILTVWGPAFSFTAGCHVVAGQLRDRGQGRFAIERYGAPSTLCARREAPPPFAGAELQATPMGDTKLAIEADGRKWLFVKVDTLATVARDEFLRGDWLLADARGQPYRGAELTRVSFGDRGYAVESAHCQFQENGWMVDRDWIVRPAGSQSVQARTCRAATLGDKLALLGSEARFTAEPVETRLRVNIGSRVALLVPAARFPELAKGAASQPVNQWAQRLSETVRAKRDDEQPFHAALRAIGLDQAEPHGLEEDVGAVTRRQAFAGLTRPQYLAAWKLGLLPNGDSPPPTLRQHFASAPLAVVGSLEGIVPVDRGDGLALDYHYRVGESWRGDRRPGDLLIVRMPPLIDKSRSPLITPEPGAPVLLLASRTGYLFGRLIEGKPPSVDPRVVAMTLPLMRVRDGRLVEAMAGANVLGAAAFVGTPLDEARTTAREVAAAIAAAAGSAAKDRRYFVSRIGTHRLADPTLVWIDYDPELRTASTARIGGVTRYFDGCTWVGRDQDLWITAAVACPPAKSEPDRQRLLATAVAWIEQHGLPVDVVTNGPGAGPYAPIVIPLPETEIELRALLR